MIAFEEFQLAYDPQGWLLGWWGTVCLNEAENAFETRKRAFAQTVPDYEEVMTKSDVELPLEVVKYLKASPLGVIVAYFLAKDRETCQRVAWMPGAQAMQALMRLERKVRAPRLTLVRGVDDAVAAVSGQTP